MSAHDLAHDNIERMTNEARHVVNRALVHAIADGARHIDTEHLQAALSEGDHCERYDPTRPA